ncbi:MAG TPA: hypothetical protein VGE31_01670 [Candidatus Paceibacterota bacterium]
MINKERRRAMTLIVVSSNQHPRSPVRQRRFKYIPPWNYGLMAAIGLNFLMWWGIIEGGKRALGLA